MNKAVISVEELSKIYRLGQIGTGTLTNDLKVWLARRRGKPNPLLKIGQTDQGNQSGELIWALKDVSFQVEQGEVLGIIGKNGAGKSTLLKILSRVTAPTSGMVKVKGRIASLLEVGTGFHPELTGRENIYLNGAILGMTKDEVKRKFDEIVNFAEIEQFIDTPVKRYSSGMYVRLAFAVAAHLESEILLVDEVLAVGDAEFQKKCLGKMGEVSSKEGRTVLFVSHNMASIEQLTKLSIVLKSGELVFNNITPNAIEYYLGDPQFGKNKIYYLEGNNRKLSDLSMKVQFIQVEFEDISKPFYFNNETIRIVVTVRGNHDVSNFRFNMTIYRFDGIPVGSFLGIDSLSIRRGEINKYRINLSDIALTPGKYYCGISTGRSLDTDRHIEFDVVHNILEFEIQRKVGDGISAGWSPNWGIIELKKPLIEKIET